MSKFDLYDINLENVSSKQPYFEFEYILDEDFFKLFKDIDIKKGLINVNLKIKKEGVLFHFVFSLKGHVEVICDRCLEPMQQLIEYNDTLKVKFGEKYNDQEEIIIVAQSNPKFNISWFLYEYITLNIPITHAHEETECKNDIINKLNNYIIGNEKENNKKTNIDPRWEKLKEIII